MTFVAEEYDFVIGIDTHGRTHTYAIIKTRTGARTACESFPVTEAGMHRAIAWIQHNTVHRVLGSVGGTRPYGASISRFLNDGGTVVAELNPHASKQARAGIGKTDEIDATAAAMSILGTETALLLQPRSEGVRAALSLLLTRRRRLDRQRTANRNALNALVRQIDLGLDARHALSDEQIGEIISWRTRQTDTLE